MGTERNLIPVIDSLSRCGKSVDEAIERFKSLPAGEFGGTVLPVDPMGLAANAV